MWQEISRKLIERAFRVLQAKFQCLVRPVLLHNPEKISNMVVGCIIMHNMMVEHRRTINEVENTHFYDNMDTGEVGTDKTDKNVRGGRSCIG
jgi:hypothetical protein